MSDVEALLSVDGGQIPPGTMAFFLADADATVARTHWALSATAVVAALAAASAGAGRFLVALLVLAAAGLAVLAWPMLPEADDDEESPRPAKRQVMVVTSAGIIVRDEWGLRSWRFDDLACVLTGNYAGLPHLVLVERNGTRHAVNHLKFQGATRLREVLDDRLRRRG
jgi:hypothetical protein